MARRDVMAAQREQRERARALDRRLERWTPFERAYTVPSTGAILELRIAEMENAARSIGREPDRAEIVAMIREIERQERWKNSRYTVTVNRAAGGGEGQPGMIELSIKRNDKGVVGPERFRDFQRIKNELIGPEHEAVELYPAESRLMDTANQYWLYVIADPEIAFPFGKHGARVVVGPNEIGLARQQSFEE